MIKVIALKEHTYAGINRKADEVYEIDPRFLQTLVALKKVKPFTETETATTEAQPRGRYNRRDLRAKE